MLTVSLIVFSQEVVSDLSYNPDLYFKHVANERAKRNGTTDNFIPFPNTLQLPFVDDFSKYHLKSYDLDDMPVVYSVNSSAMLRGTIHELNFMNDTSWTYFFNTVTQQKDSLPKQPIQFVLNNDTGNIYLPTDTVSGWPEYFVYTFDNAGNITDSALIAPDSTIEYSIYHVVHDGNALWLDNFVYVNDDYPVNKLSYGVATFDGLDQFGLPFNGNSLDVYGPADTLTSKPINLLGLLDSNVVLSFLYQPQGLGNRPEFKDPLILEFKRSETNWDRVWIAEGFDSNIDTFEFEYVLLKFDSLLVNEYFASNFQFRFRNLATISGNNDHWHIDYVYLDKNRNDTINPVHAINDLTVLNPATSFLKNYTSMPWDHFEGYESSEQVSPITLSFRNNYAVVQNRPIKFIAKEVYSGDTLFDYPAVARNLNPLTSFSTSNPGAPAAPFVSDSFLPYSPAGMNDSLYFDIITSIVDTQDLTQDNNNVSSPVLFENYFAYDDGTAERAYGLEPQGLLKFACKFHLNHPDTLRAIQFYFAQVNENLSLLEFTLMVWRDIGIGGASEDTLFAQPGTAFYYASERNGYVTYRIDPPIVLDFSVIPDSTFYVGWQQLFSENIQLGLDLNNDYKQHMFYYSSGTWKKSNLTQFEQYAPMIRPVVGKKLPVVTGTVDNPAARGEVILYPNPAENMINLVLPPNADRIEIFDLQGRLVKKVSNPAERIDITGLTNGLYCLRVSSNDKVWVRKFVKH